MKYLFFLVLAAALTSGCAAWRPVIDRQADAHPENVDRDIEQCRQLAEQASGKAGDKALKGGAVGAAGGAAVGAMLGAVSGDAGGGAAMGAVIGGAGGSASQGMSASDRYQATYRNCLSGRGHRVLN